MRYLVALLCIGLAPLVLKAQSGSESRLPLWTDPVVVRARAEAPSALAVMYRVPSGPLLGPRGAMFHRPEMMLERPRRVRNPDTGLRGR